MLGAGDSLPSNSGRSILAVRAGALGDTILVLPAIAALRRLSGRTGEVDFAGTEPWVHLATGPRNATRVHSIDRSMFRALFQESADDGELLSFLGRFGLVAAWSNLPLLEGKLAKLGIPLLHASPHPPPDVHASDHLHRSLSPLGVHGPAPPPSIDLDEESGLAAGDFLRARALPPAGSSLSTLRAAARERTGPRPVSRSSRGGFGRAVGPSSGSRGRLTGRSWGRSRGSSRPRSRGTSP